MRSRFNERLSLNKAESKRGHSPLASTFACTYKYAQTLNICTIIHTQKGRKKDPLALQVSSLEEHTVRIYLSLTSRRTIYFLCFGMVIIYLGMKDQIGQKDIIFILHTVIKK